MRQRGKATKKFRLLMMVITSEITRVFNSQRMAPQEGLGGLDFVTKMWCGVEGVEEGRREGCTRLACLRCWFMRFLLHVCSKALHNVNAIWTRWSCPRTWWKEGWPQGEAESPPRHGCQVCFVSFVFVSHVCKDGDARVESTQAALNEGQQVRLCAIPRSFPPKFPKQASTQAK